MAANAPHHDSSLVGRKRPISLYTGGMSWAGRRKALIITIGSIALLAVFAIFAFGIFYETPTCTDRKQNQGEAGVDCGGECSRLCAFEVSYAPVVRFVRVLTPEAGRVDIVAYIDNPNADAAAARAPFVLELYDANRTLVAKRTLEVDLPESTTIPVYVPNAAPRGSGAVQAFLTPDTASTVWQKPSEEERILPSVEDIVISESTMPRVTARLVNPLAEPIRNTLLVATLFDPSGNALAASQTIVPTLPPQGASALVFTWREPFSAPVARVEILPVIPVDTRAP